MPSAAFPLSSILAITGAALVALGLVMQLASLGGPLTVFIAWNLLTTVGIILLIVYRMTFQPSPWSPRILKDRPSSGSGPVHRYCPACGAENKNESRFCHLCGERLPVPASSE